jgi:hypothetical protein
MDDTEAATFIEDGRARRPCQVHVGRCSKIIRAIDGLAAGGLLHASRVCTRRCIWYLSMLGLPAASPL